MLYLVRHGQTELNWAGRMQGRTDSKLTERGQQQARVVGEKLKALLGGQSAELWVSPLGRAQETASILRDYISVSKINNDERLAEISLGDWEGMTMEDIEFTHPGVLDGSGRFDWAYRAPGGESESALLERLEEWLRETDIDRARIVAVSHGWAGMALRSIHARSSFAEVSAKGDSHEAVFELSNGVIREL